MQLRKLQCVNCAGKIDGATLTCQSCGMQYRIDDDFSLKVVSSNLRWATLSGQIAVPAYILSTLGSEQMAEITLKQMAESMAPRLLPFMEFQSMFDPRYNTINTVGRIRVAEPLVSRQGHVTLEMPKPDKFDWRAF